MTKDKIEYISRLMYESQRWRKISGWGTLLSFAALTIDISFRHIGAGSLLFESALVGGFISSWGSHFDRATRFKRELDTICFALFGKNHDSSYLEIIEMGKTKLI